MVKNVSHNKASLLIEQLIAYSIDKLSIKTDDIHYVRNQLLDLFCLSEPAPASNNYGDLQEEILNPLVEYAINNKIIKDVDFLLFETRVMGIVTPPPSQVTEEFDLIATNDGILKASEYFYNQCIASNYIRKVDINKNIGWSFTGSRGNINITINLSKPEKDPKEVLLAAKTPATNYPKCKLCASNVGFNGNYNYPARQTLRTIPIYLNEENWHFQYSPYCYFNEHLIALSDDHRPMVVDSNALTRMFDFVEIFPQYFIGSNAALPIVGGSILSHDHYQGGSKVMPMMDAEVLKNYSHPRFQSVTLSVLDWYNSVVRLSSADRTELLKAAQYILEHWTTYSDESVGIIAKTTEQHNAITPIVRLEGRTYVIDYILRNNRTDEIHPYGIYHPTEDLHNIKKESIGIIEVMGLFILPGRLYNESQMIKDYLTGAKRLDFKELMEESHPLHKHLTMIAQLSNDHGLEMNDADANEAIMSYINVATEKILTCTALFKNTPEGEKAFKEYIFSLGFDENTY